MLNAENVLSATDADAQKFFFLSLVDEISMNQMNAQTENVFLLFFLLRIRYS